MYLMYYDDDEGNRVYTLKVSPPRPHGAAAAAPAATIVEMNATHLTAGCFSAAACLHDNNRKSPPTAPPPSRHTQPGSRLTTSSAGSASPARSALASCPRRCQHQSSEWSPSRSSSSSNSRGPCPADVAHELRTTVCELWAAAMPLCRCVWLWWPRHHLGGVLQFGGHLPCVS